MIKEQRHIQIFGSVDCVYPVSTSKKTATLINFRVAFFVNRELLRILPMLILSSINQKLTIYPNDLLNILSCTDLRLSTGTAYLLGLFSNGVIAGDFLGY